MEHIISKEERERCEKFIREHEPYPEDAPEAITFDGGGDPDRRMARLMKKYLEGKIK